MSGTVYVTERHSDFRVKIGITDRPMDFRFAELKRKHGTLGRVWENWHAQPRLVEARAHWLLSDFRMDGEWFDVPEHTAVEAVRHAICLVDADLEAKAYLAVVRGMAQ